jgi:hypothetical protein
MAKKRFFVESELVFEEKPRHGKLKDLQGQSFGRLTVIGYAGTEKENSYWYCKCNCIDGNITKAYGGNLRFGVIKSCGCLAIELTKEKSTTHGHNKNGKQSRTYITWLNMLTRCQNPNTPNFMDYGGRGIEVCKRWQKFENFLLDMGERPKGKTLDRKENDKGYYLENCRWASKEEQQNNRRNNINLTYRDKTQTITQWGREINMPPRVINYRIKTGWSIERTLTTPHKMRNSKS